MPWIRRVRTSPPLDADVGIDWDNPLNKDIGFLSYDVGQGHRNLVTGAQAITQGDAAQGVNVVGPGGLFSSSGISQVHPAVQTTSAFVSFACLYVKTGTAESFGRIFGRTARNGTAIPYTNWDFELNPNAEGQTRVVASLAAGSDAYFSTGSTGSRPTVADDGAPHFLFAENTDGGKLSIWIDGVKNALQSSVGAGVAYNNTTNDKIIFSGSSDAANANRVATYVPIGMFWNRGVSADEIASITANPYQLLEPELVWMPVAGGAGSVTLDAAATAQSTATADLSHGVTLAGAALSVASATAGMSLSVPLAATATATASASGLIALSVNLSANAVAQAVATADLNSGSVSLAANATSVATAGATLALAVNLSASAIAQAVASAELGGSATLAAAAIANAQATSALAVGKPLAAAAQGASTATATLWVQVPLSAAALAQAAAGASLSLTVTLDANALGNASASAALPGTVTLAAAGVSVATAGATLQVGGAIDPALNRMLTVRQLPRNWSHTQRHRTFVVVT